MQSEGCVRVVRSLGYRFPQLTPRRRARPGSPGSDPYPSRMEDECAITWLPRPRYVDCLGCAGPVRNATRPDRYGPPLPHRGPRRAVRPGPSSPREQYQGSSRGCAQRPRAVPHSRRAPRAWQGASSRRPRGTTPWEGAGGGGSEAAVARPYLAPGDELVGVGFLHKRPQLAEESRHVRTLLHC